MSSKAKSVALPAVMDLDALDALRDALLDAIEDGPVTLRADAVERVSTNSLFMLMSAAATARRNQFAFSIERPSPALVGAMDRLGLGAEFQGMITQ